MNTKELSWTDEFVTENTNSVLVNNNQCLDFHGNPLTAELVIFSDGNHHKALLETCKAFKESHNKLSEIFFVTTPPSVLISILESGVVTLGNLSLNLRADFFISPDFILQQLKNCAYIESHQCFSKSRHNSLLIRKDNPKQITAINDLFNRDTTLAISNPETEKASFTVYSSTLRKLGEKNNNTDFLNEIIARSVISQNIHHREIPEIIANGTADAAILYHHLAKSYVERFPDIFGMIEYQDEYPDIDLQTNYHYAIVNNRNPFALDFEQFLLSKTAQDIYQSNGLSGC